MTLSEYVREHGTSSKRDLAMRAGLRWQTVHLIAEGLQRPKIETARRLSKATRGAVSVAELLGLSSREVPA